MIQIDDAGNGAVLGGEVIGALRVETGEYVHEILPLSAYSFFEIPRIYAAKTAVIKILQKLTPAVDEEILICTGDIFKEVKVYLSEQNINWREEKITGSLQELVEASFFNSLRAYGLPEKFRAFHHDYHRFHNLVFNWVCQDLPRRSKFCKPLRLNSGLVSRAKFFKTVLQKACTCELCKRPMPANSIGVIDKTEEQAAYYHLECFPVEVDLCDFQETSFQGQVLRSFINKSSSPPQCAVCLGKIKYKKRIISFNDTFFHLGCITHMLQERSSTS